ncbi:MAG: molybdopterin-dependent oxidoreductase [Aeromicrobium erythreum]
MLYPLRRTGPKGAGEFERITWDEAIAEIAARFTQVKEEHGPEAIMPVSYLGTQGIINGLNVGDPFFNRLGATVAERTYCDSGSCNRLRDDDRRHTPVSTPSRSCTRSSS